MALKRTGPTAFGRMVAARRKARGMGMEKLAQVAGVSASQISYLESGKRGQRVGRDIVLKLATGLGIDPADALQAAGLAVEEESQVESAIENDPYLTQDDRAMLLAMYHRMVNNHH